MRRQPPARTGLNRLRDFVIAMTPGEQVNTQQAMLVSGLGSRDCHTLLDALVRGGFTIRLQHDAYIRRDTDDVRVC